MIHIRRLETYLSPRDAARFSGLSQNDLRRYVKHGRLTAYRTAGGHRRFARSELVAISKVRRAPT